MGGRSSSSQATNQTDNRRVIGEGGISAEGSNVVYTINNTTLDSEVVNRAFDFGSGAFDLTSDAIAEALGFGGRALDAALDVTSDAMDFADRNATRNSQMAYNVVGDALAANESALARSFNFGANALGDAMGIGEGALNKAFSFGNNALGAAFDTLGSTQNMVKDAYADAKGRGALTDKMIMGAIAAMAVVAFAAIKK